MLWFFLSFTFFLSQAGTNYFLREYTSRDDKITDIKVSVCIVLFSYLFIYFFNETRVKYYIEYLDALVSSSPPLKWGDTVKEG